MIFSSVATAKHCITETGARGSIIYGTNDNTKTDNMVNFTIDDVIFNQFGYVDVVLIRTREAMKVLINDWFLLEFVH